MPSPFKQFAQLVDSGFSVEEAARRVDDGLYANDIGKNKLINGNFDFWQRGSSHSTGGYGSADRWRLSHNGSTDTLSRQSFTLGQTDVPGNPEYFSRATVVSSAGAGNYAIQQQYIEGVETFAGQTCTLSFYAKADAAKNIAIEFYQYFGTGGSPSSPVSAIGVTTVALTGSWAKYTVTASIPSISGKTIGSDNNDALIVDFWLDAGSNFDARTNSLGQQDITFDLARVQLEAGDTATDFQRAGGHIGGELALCQRYYWQGKLNGRGYGWHYGTTSADYQAMGEFSFPATMRTSPTLSIVTAPTYANCTHRELTGNEDGFMHRVLVTSAGQYRAYDGVYDADAEL